MSELQKNIARRILKIASVIVAVLGLFVLLLAGMLSTESGSRVLVNYGIETLNSGEALTIEIETVSGTVYSGLSFTGLRLQHPSVDLSAGSMSSAWNFWNLLTGNLTVDAVQVSDLHLALPEATANDEEGDGDAGAEIPNLPALSLPRIVVQGFTTDVDPRLAAQRISAAVTTSGNQILIEELDLDSASAGAQANISLQLGPVLEFELDAAWQLTENLIPDLPALAGRTSIRGNLEEIQLEQELQSPYGIVSQGSISKLASPDELEFDLSHRINLVRLPQFPAPLESLAITGVTRGSMEEVTFEASGEVGLLDLPRHQLSVQGDWSGQQLRLSALELQQGETSMSGSMALSLGEAIGLSGLVEIVSLNPLDYLPGESENSWLPLDIDGQAEFEAQDLDANPRVTADLRNLHMLARDNEILGSGQIDWSDAGLFVRGLQLDSDTTHVTLDGTVGANNALDWQLEIEDIGQFVADATGSVRGSGQLSGSQQAPFGTGSLAIDALSLGPLQVNSFTALVEGSPEQYQAELRLQEFVFETPAITETITASELQITGNDTQFTLALETLSEHGAISLHLDGGPLRQNPVQWQGNIARARLTAGRDWILSAPVPVNISAEQVTLGNTCLNSDGSLLCFELDSILEAETGDFAVSLSNFPLQELASVNQSLPFLTLQALPAFDPPDGVSFSGQLDGSLAGGFAPDEPPELTLSLSSAAPVMSMQQQNDLDNADMDQTTSAMSSRDYRWRDISLNGQFQDAAWNLLARGALLEQSIDGVVTPLQGNVDLTLAIAADQTINGSSNAEFDDLSWLEVYVPDMSNIRGELHSDFEVSGDLQQPQLSGFFSVEDAGFSLDRWGVRIEQFSGELTASDTGVISLLARAETDTGELSLNGTATNLLAGDASLEMNLLGSEFQLLESEQLSLRVSPNLSLRANQERIDVSGSILLPELLIAMESIPESAINVSSDVVIVNYSPEETGVVNSLAAENSRFLNIPITAELDIVLGESVRFEGFGLTTALVGELETEVLENGSNRTFGELTITEGSYSLYGQSLQIDEGKLLFIGPYDNPGLEIVATRRIDDQMVGVQMNGTLRNLQSDLISTPNLPDAEVIALIATGRPFSELGNTDEDALLGSIARLGLERGRGISERVRTGLGLDTLAITNTGNINNSLLTVGKYLTPSLFVRYGLGLFDSQSKVAVDYDLTSTLKLQAESGEHQSLDLTYSIER